LDHEDPQLICDDPLVQSMTPIKKSVITARVVEARKRPQISETISSSFAGLPATRVRTSVSGAAGSSDEASRPSSKSLVGRAFNSLCSVNRRSEEHTSELQSRV